MRWFTAFFWLGWTAWAYRRRWRAFPTVIRAGLALSMAGQWALLALDGQWSAQTALPLHLCAVSALLCMPAGLWRSRRALAWQLHLGAPCAALALCFPAVIASSRPALMELCFFSLHALILCAALWQAADALARREPLPADGRGTLVAANAYLAVVSAFNRAFDTNYLFLRRAPAGTPLATMAAGGAAGYLAALELGTILLLTLTGVLYGEVNRRALSRPADRPPPPCPPRASATAPRAPCRAHAAAAGQARRAHRRDSRARRA